jgi:hypothetical protein
MLRINLFRLKPPKINLKNNNINNKKPFRKYQKMTINRPIKKRFCLTKNKQLIIPNLINEIKPTNINLLPTSIYDYNNIDEELLKLDLKYYIIHLEKATNRLKNIEELKNKLNCELTIFNAIDGNDILEITEEGIIFKTIKIEAPYTLDICIKDKLYPGEIGNYFSHLSLLYQIKKLNLIHGYTIIFEDDIFINSDIDKRIRGILDKIDDFDILYLGNTKNNFSEKYIDEIYYIDKTKVLWGTYGYVINNKKINNFYENFSNFNSYTDIIIKNLINDDKIVAYVVNPCIVIQNYEEFPSQIIRKKSNILLKYLKNIKTKK